MDKIKELIFEMELRYPISTPFIIGSIIVVTIGIVGTYYLPAKYANILTWLSFILVSFFAVRRAFRNVAFLKAIEEGRIKVSASKIIKEIEESKRRR